MIRKRYFILVLFVLVSLGFYYVKHMREVAAEQARILAESRKIEKKIFGQSTQGKPIEGYVVGNGAKTVLLFSAIHGDEIGTTDLLNTFIDELKADPTKISSAKRLVVIPISNPDGYYDRVDKFNANLVNLNLNFETADWKDHGPEGTYAGPKPFSEVESQALKKVVEDYKPEMMIAYHARGALVTPESDEASIALAHRYADATGYEYYVDWDYPGTATKWFVEATHKPAITVELTAYRPSDWEINKKILMELASGA